MKLRDILADRIQMQPEGTQEYNLVSQLNKKADEIIKLASAQLERTSHVFGKMDQHGIEHAEKVLGYIEDLLGDAANELPSYDLFSLIAVSYLHDCGLAVSDYEIRVMELVEGEPAGKSLMTQSEAETKIKENLDRIYGHDKYGFDGMINHWPFKPAIEKELLDYLAELWTDYQDYRNGSVDKLKAGETNQGLRLDYLRSTHHQRIVTYINNLRPTIFSGFPITGIGVNLGKMIANCCESHSAPFSNVTDLSDRERLSIGGSCHPQFIAMMLRLGDILHFSYDRLHPALYKLHQFQTEYSIQGLGQNVEEDFGFVVNNGEVICNASCKTPRHYYYVSRYVEAINGELEEFGEIRKQWENFPRLPIKAYVNTDDLDYDKEKFQPAPNLKFTLDQNKVLELLMGAKLYSDDYACLRELYQNSLDACRCQMAKDEAQGRPSKGRIEFGLGEEERYGTTRKYVYCLDNGKGMTRTIIEQYMLHIGSSYYRSREFFKKQAKTGAKFTPTSQFGIGILSCFMIGDEIEITTCEEGSKDGVVSCVMERINEYFYYQSPKLEDAEKVKNPSGTLVKVYLNEKYQELLNDDPLEKLGYLLWCDSHKVEIEHDKERWKHHLYRIMNDFIIVVPDGVDVNIELKHPTGGKETIKIYNKPLPIIAELRPYANINYEIKGGYKSYFDKFKNMEYKVIRVQEKGLECRTVIDFADNTSWWISVNGKNRCCVDGIGISHLENDRSILYLLDNRRVGIINFIGENRPQLSVSREKIIGPSLSDYDNDARTLLEKLIKESIKEVCAYIRGKGILPNNSLYDKIWGELLRKFDFCYPIVYRCLKDHTDCHDMQLPFINKAMSFGNLLIADETKIPKDMLYKKELDDPIYSFLLLRLLESESIEVKDENTLMAKGRVGIPAFVPDIISISKSIDDDYLCIHPSGYNIFWKEYDFVPFGKVRFISDNLWQNVSDYLKDKADEDYNFFTNSWIYSALLNYIKSILSDFDDEIDARRRVNSLGDSFGFNLNSRIRSSFYKETNSYHQVDYFGLTSYTQDYSVLAVRKHEFEDWICFARRGKHTRQELLDSITGERREEIKNVLFPNGDVLSPQ